jgi:hypothetical protein
MDARKVAAQFAARVWYEENRAGRASRKEVNQFARQNWNVFLPVADEGFGRLLIRVLSQGRARSVALQRRPSLALA